MGVLLSHASLAEERQASAELEALHRFSVFCLHDLKNLASRLSLVAQNAESHGRDPAFQESAIRTVSDTAKKMTALMSKLSLKSFKPSLAGAPVPVDLSTLIDEVIAPIRAEHLVQTAGHRRAGPSGDGGQGPDSPSLAERGVECQTGHRPSRDYFDRTCRDERFGRRDDRGYGERDSSGHARDVVSPVAIQQTWWAGSRTVSV